MLASCKWPLYLVIAQHAFCNNRSMQLVLLLVLCALSSCGEGIPRLGQTWPTIVPETVSNTMATGMGMIACNAITIAVMCAALSATLAVPRAP
jgi:hypothetical protein